MASFRFGLQPLKNNTVLIRATMQDPATNGGKPIYKSTGFTIPAAQVNQQYKHWNAKEYRVKQLDNMLVINAKLSDWQNKWDNYIKDCDFHNRTVNIEHFRASLSTGTGIVAETDKTAIPTTLLQLGNLWIKHIKGEEGKGATTYKADKKTITHSPETIGGYEACVADIEAYQKAKGPVLLDDVNATFYRNFGLFLIKTNNNYNNTINRKVGRIRTMMRFAAQPDRLYTTSTAFTQSYKFTPSKAKRFPLKPEEIEILKGYHCPDPKDELHLDAFRFACETTLRFSDVIQLKPVHRQERMIGDTKIYTLDLTQIKTVNENSIALSDYAISIWDKYAVNGRRRIFNLFNSTTSSDKLKDIFADMGLNRLVEVVRTQGNKVERDVMPLHKAISFHMSRNTAITFQLSHLSPATVMQNAGIKKMETLMGYYRDDEERRMLETLKIQNKE